MFTLNMQFTTIETIPRETLDSALTTTNQNESTCLCGTSSQTPVMIP